MYTIIKNCLLVILLLPTIANYTLAQHISLDQLKAEYVGDEVIENRPNLMLADFLGENGEESDFADLCYFIVDEMVNEMDYFKREQDAIEEPIQMSEFDDNSNTGFSMAVSTFIKGDQIIAKMQLNKDYGTTLLFEKTMSIQIEKTTIDKDFSAMPNAKKYSTVLGSFYKEIALPMLNNLLSVVASDERLKLDPGEQETLLINEEGRFFLVFENVNISQTRTAQASLRNLAGVDQVKISPQNHHHLTVYTELPMPDLVSSINEHLGEEHVIVNQEGDTIYLEQL